VPEDAIYNTTTHEPNPLPGNGTANAKRGLSEMSSKMLSRRANQPIAVAGPVKMPRW
jgi:hypothetical protein